MDKNEFKVILSNIKTAISVTGKKYTLINILGDSIIFVREGKKNTESISISELYDFYTKEDIINTAIAKTYISGRVQSPAVAILSRIKTVNHSSARAVENISYNNVPQENLEIKANHNIKAETLFFIALSEIIGTQFMQSKSIGKPVDSTHIFLSNNYRDYLFEPIINECYVKILKDLRSNNLFSSDSLSQHIDCVILNHPLLKNRIVEFDEEQHFTPARMDTLKHLPQIVPDNYFSKFNEICKNITYLNESVLSKHRIKNKLKKTPSSFVDFTQWLEQSKEKTSGYICEKNGFEFLGGRIAQRAYYDSLRDTAHLSVKNSGFQLPLRFAKKAFEDKEKMSFSQISKENIKKIIIEILKTEYKIVLPKLIS